ncbi:MAG TPA: aminotransferase class I/II-fold pyridoxal phosphate-dependent enzyme [Chroococcales cyanobacterium]|jgi:aspartate/methionine/tyrosine aminotransferase
MKTSAHEFLPFALERWLVRYEPVARLHLAGIGLAPLTLAGLEEMKVLPKLDDLPIGYVDSNGQESLREAIAGTYEKQGKENVLVTHGGIEALHLILLELAEPGKRAVVMAPGYQGMSEPLRAAGMEIEKWNFFFEKEYAPDFLALEELLSTAKILVLNSPHNPTGALLSEEDLKKVLSLAEKNDCHVVCDEVYRGLSLDGKSAPSVADLSPKAFATGSLSKLYGLPGLRIGWIVGDPTVLQRCWERKDYSSLSNNTLGERIAESVLIHHSLFLERAARLASSNWKTLKTWLLEHQEEFEWVDPRAGLALFPRLKKEKDAEKFCLELLEKEGVLLLPGKVYEKENHLRFGFGNFAPLPEGLKALDGFLKKRKAP